MSVDILLRPGFLPFLDGFFLGCALMYVLISSGLIIMLAVAKMPFELLQLGLFLLISYGVDGCGLPVKTFTQNIRILSLLCCRSTMVGTICSRDVGSRSVTL